MKLLIKMKPLLLSSLLLVVAGVSGQAKRGELSNIQKITNQTGEAYENPQWSPDGSKIAYTKTGFTGLLVMDKNGSNKKTLSTASDVGYKFQWSDNNDQILMRDTRWDGSKGRVHAIWAVGMNGNAERVSEDATYLQPASWMYGQDGRMQVKLIDGKLKEATNMMQRAAKLNNPNLVKLKAKKNFNKSFFVDGENFYLVDEIGNKTLLNDKNTYCPVFSPDGTKIAFNQDDNVCVMNIDGSSKRVLSRGFYPTWVNNKQLVFERTEDDGHEYTSGDLYMINIDGSSENQITNTKHIEKFPTCSPDGSKLLFIRIDDGQVYSADLK